MRFWSQRVKGSADQDRVSVACRGDRWTVVVADGAGGIAGGAAAADRVVESLAAAGAEAELGPDDWCEKLWDLDRELEARSVGESTAVVVQARGGEVWGAAAGDSGALLISASEVVDLTAHRKPKPLMGSGACRPVSIVRRTMTGRLLVATDGLLKYVAPEKLAACARAGDLAAAVGALIEAARLPGGSLPDDIALALGERTTRAAPASTPGF